MKRVAFLLALLVLAGCGGGGSAPVVSTGPTPFPSPDPFGSPVPLSDPLILSSVFGSMISVHVVTPPGETVRSYYGPPLGPQTSVLTTGVLAAFTATFEPAAVNAVDGCSTVSLPTPPAGNPNVYIRIVDATSTPVEIAAISTTLESLPVILIYCGTLKPLTYTLIPGRTYGFVVSTSP